MSKEWLEEAAGGEALFMEATQSVDCTRQGSEGGISAPPHSRPASSVNHDDDGSASTASGGGDNRRGKCYKCGVRGHFKRECPLMRKEPAAGRALLVDDGVEDTGLL